MSFEFLHSSQNDSTNSAIQADPSAAPVRFEADVLVIFFESNGLRGPVVEIDEATGGLLQELYEQGEITGKRYECIPLYAPRGLACKQLLVVGIGSHNEVDAGVLYEASGTAARRLSCKPRATVGFLADGNWSNEQLEQAVAGATMGVSGQDLYRSEKHQTPFEKTVWLQAPVEVVQRGHIIGDGVKLARRLVNMPPDNLYPETFAEEAATIAGRVGLEIEIWDKARLERERCEALLAVARGSTRSPRIVLLHYRGPGCNKTEPKVAFVGKGVTFDSGGLSLKTSEGMLAMKCDMAGAAAALGTIAAIAALKIPVHVVAAVGLVENMTGGNAYKLGDVVTARSGTTIEIHNTDAEGRVVLADVLDVVADLKPGCIIDAATLTGACMVALGRDIAGVFTNNQSSCDVLKDAAHSVGERVWQLPMDEDFNSQILSDVADIKNVGDGRLGGAITAAKLLERFVRDIPWTHVDIAGPAFADKPRPSIAGGGTGSMVRSFIEFTKRIASKKEA
jgi:leucyl aminopeptidase